MNKQEVLALLVADLREKLTELGLSTNGRKPELQNRLLAHYGLQADEDNEGIEVDEDDEGSFESVHSNNMQAGGRSERNAVVEGQTDSPFSFR